MYAPSTIPSRPLLAVRTNTCLLFMCSFPKAVDETQQDSNPKITVVLVYSRGVRRTDGSSMSAYVP